jgi:hypothetical protein
MHGISQNAIPDDTCCIYYFSKSNEETRRVSNIKIHGIYKQKAKGKSNGKTPVLARLLGH